MVPASAGETPRSRAGGRQRGEAPAATEVPPLSQPPSASLFTVEVGGEAMGLIPHPVQPWVGALGTMGAVPLLGRGAGLAHSKAT